MSDIYARINTHARNKIRVVSQINENVYGEIVISDYVLYDGENDVSGDGWIGINSFSRSEYYDSTLVDVGRTLDCLDLAKKDSPNLLIVSDGDKKYYQIVAPKFLRRKGIVIYGDRYEYVDDNCNMLSINEFPDAVYDGSRDVLMFRNEDHVAKIFGKLKELFREASIEEAGAFIGETGIVVSEEFDLSRIGKRNLKRIHKLQGLGRKLQESRMISYLKKYRKELFCHGKIVISCDSDLVKVLDGLEGRYYTGELDAERMIANSRRKLES